MESYERWEGQVIDGVFPLQRYLGGNAVFLTEHEARQAVIKLVPADAARLEQWRAAIKLSHPHLLRLFQAGRCRIEGTELNYAAMECADENLSQVLPGRALTPAEAGEMLVPVLDALGYLHRQGLAHGRMKPSNIMAAGDQVKLSCDHVSKGEPGDDVRALGATLVEVVTQRRPMWPHLPEGLEQPFRDIAEHTLHPDPRKRWTLDQIGARLRGITPPKRSGIRWQFMLPVAAAGLAILVFAWRSGGSRTEPPPVSPPAAASAPAPTVAKPEPVTKEAPDPKPAATVTKSRPPSTQPASTQPASKGPTQAAGAPGVEQQVMPEIPHKAISTIHGTMVVNVRIQVEPSGNVSEAKLEPPAASHYFAKYTLDAARRWKFQPSDAPREWTLRFVFTKKDSKVFPRRIS